jgi:NADH:ubiquinone oxidoreductase subunit F (NADH-binding)
LESHDRDGDSSRGRALLPVRTPWPGHTICALSDAAAWAAGYFARRFHDDFARHVRERRCPYAETSFEI